MASTNCVIYLTFLLAMTIVSVLPGASAVNGTDEVPEEAEQQPWFNTTDVEAPENEVNETEVEAGNAEENAVVVENETGNAENEAAKAEEVATPEDEVPEVNSTLIPQTLSNNSTRMQTIKDWGGRVLASKYMGSLAVLYLALCVYLAIQHGPVFVR